MTSRSAREAATAHLQQADAAINTMFDRHDELTATLTKVSETATSESNVFTRAQQLAEAAATATAQVEALRAAALEASEFRAKRDLARDLEASPNAVFPPQSSDSAATSPEHAESNEAA